MVGGGLLVAGGLLGRFEVVFQPLYLLAGCAV